MSETMKAVLERLDLLAAKLNTTGEHLWEVLTKQGMFEAVYASAWVVIAIAYCYYYAKKLKGLLVKCDCKNNSDAEDVFYGVLTVVGGILFIGAVISMFVNSGNMYGLINPEYFALQEILGG